MTSPSAEQVIAGNLWEQTKARGRKPTWMFIAVRRRLQQILDDVKDPFQVELLARRIEEEDGERFSASALSYARYEFWRDQLQVPEGAWEYALMAHLLPAGRDQDSVDYWVAQWQDAITSDHMDGVIEAREMLKRVGDRVYDAE